MSEQESADRHAQAAESERAHRSGWLRERRSAAVITACFALTDALLRSGDLERWLLRDWLAWLGSLALSFLLWSWLIGCWRSPRRGVKAIGAGLSIALCWGATASVFYYLEFQSYPVSTTVRYLIEEPASAAALIGDRAFAPLTLCAQLLPPLLLLWLTAARGRSTPEPAAPRRNLQRRLLSLCLGLVLYLPLLAKVVLHQSLSPDVHGLVQIPNALGQLLFQVRDRLHAGHRTVPASLSPSEDAPNLLWIVHEALSPRHLSLYGAPFESSPAQRAWYERAGHRAVRFENAQSNSGFTMISVVSLFTGLSPTRNSVAVHQAPLPWTWARAAGYHSFLFTAQSYRWASMDLFFLDEHLEHYETAETSGLPIVNDVGVDDRKVMDRARGHLRSLAREAEARRAAGERPQPFWGILHFHGTHEPFLVDPAHRGSWPTSDEAARRKLDAILNVDSIVGEVVETLEESGLEENTFVLLTADHGARIAALNEPHPENRTENHYEVVLRVPMLLIAPTRRSPRLEAGLAQLHAARRQRVSNLDLLPTSLDLIGLRGEAYAAQYRSLDGRSLLRPLPADRWISYTNVTDFRDRSNKGLALSRGQEKYVFFNRSGRCDEGYFLLDQDPKELNSRWEQLGAEGRDQIYQELQRDSWLWAIREGAPCPLADRSARPHE